MTEQIKTLGQLKASGYQSKSIKQEMRDNLVDRLTSGQPVFSGILGYEYSVIPELQLAILSGHSINFLGLRGQAKTRMARMMTELLDEYIPIIEGSEINDDPLNPISNQSRRLISENGDNTAIDWLHRSKRYSEKLATPDVNIADLIGDIDPIKAANLRLSYADEDVIHFGMIPRANRGIFVLNELPDLQPRIQVALFNILQEKDLQIRGFKLRFPLDIQFVFTANPEDYTNRGAIITPLKDRIQSQIFTHYPKTREIGKSITQQEIQLAPSQKKNIKVPELMADLVEQIAIEARKSEFIDEKSGVSARLPISAYECMVSAAERRMLINKEKQATVRIGDLTAAIPAIVGKIEMVYEGEQEGAINVAHRLIGSAIRALAPTYFSDIQHIQDKQRPEIRERYMAIARWFEEGNQLDLISTLSEVDYQHEIQAVSGLKKAASHLTKNFDDLDASRAMEYLLHVLAEYSLLDKQLLDMNYKFQDYFSSMLSKD